MLRDIDFLKHAIVNTVVKLDMEVVHSAIDD